MNQQRASSAARGYNSRWQKASRSFLDRNPLCARCAKAGRTQAATVVDHIVPHRFGPAKDSGDTQAIVKASALFWDKVNWQGLCSTCHSSAKQREERTGVVAGCDEAGNPSDPNHHWNRSR
ncbi:MAG: HNH endonuclease signature motif containing protein [Dokdonella sp.]